MVLSRRQSISHAFSSSSAPESEEDHFPSGKTFAGQGQLPKLPIPPLEETMRRYLSALEGLQVRLYFLCYWRGKLRGDEEGEVAGEVTVTAGSASQGVREGGSSYRGAHSCTRGADHSISASPPSPTSLLPSFPLLSRAQTPAEHTRTTSVVSSFLANEGPELHQRLKDYASTRASYIEEWWTESYLSHEESVVLSLNPFFILECVTNLFSFFSSSRRKRRRLTK